MSFARKRLNNDLIIISAMGKKMEDAEVKKECPSCGLGVALDSTTCEFCGWDFEEEDEWILQIEKLERDLMLEKQKFEPGTDYQKIESTLHTPSIERIEIIRARQEQSASDNPTEREQRPPPEGRSASPPNPPAATHRKQRGLREARPSEMEVRRASATLREEQEEMPKPSSVRFAGEVSLAAEPVAREAPPSPPKVRKVRTVKAPKAEEVPQVKTVGGAARTRLVRKVKK
jgi:hypothetical protein